MRKYQGKIKNETKRKEYKRKLSIRKKIVGTSERPRINAFKSNKHLFVQVINDAEDKTLFSVQTYGKDKVADSNNKEAAKKVGEKVAEKLKGAKIETAVFDRNGKIYTGVIAALADSIRENGIKI